MPNLSAEIKALIFDFGGVLVRAESQGLRERLARRLGLSRQELNTIVFDSEESHLEQLGRISAEARWQRVEQVLGLNSPEEALAFRRQFFAGDVLDTELVNYIRHMHRCYKTALLSNAGANLADLIHTRFGLDNCFDVVVISALVGMMKPDPAIYRLTLNQLQVAAHEAVFVDDALVNVEAAAAIGIHAVHFTTREALFAELEALLGEGPQTEGGICALRPKQRRTASSRS